MRTVSVLAAAAGFAVLFGTSEAQAARWCAYEGGAAMRCGFASQQQCKRTAGRSADCRRQVAARSATARNGMMPGQIYPNRPYWASPYECFLDDGNGRFRPCSAGGDGGGGLQ